MSDRTRHHWSNVLDFLAANLIIVLAVIYSHDLIKLLAPPQHLIEMVGTAKSYTAFIEGLIAGVLMSIYILIKYVLIKKKISTLSTILGMWLYPYAKFTIYTPLLGIEFSVGYFAQLSMFAGIFCVLFHLSRVGVSALSANRSP